MPFKRKIMLSSLVIIIIGIISITLLEYKIMMGLRILPGVFIGDLSTGGMDSVQAEEAIIPLFQKSMEREIVIDGGGKKWSYSPIQLGLKGDTGKTIEDALKIGRQGAIWERWYDRFETKRNTRHIPLAFHINEGNLRQHLAVMAKMIEEEAENAGIIINKDNQTEIIPGKDGLQVNIDLSLQEIKEVLLSGDKRKCSLITQVIQPNITDEVVASWQIDGVVARFETYFDPAKSDRSENIKVSAAALDHVLVMPQEIFSFNEVVGPRTTEAGYKESLVIENNEFTPGIGGGVCQVSSTLYNAILLANLTVAERHPHSLPISYMEPGRDATVSYDWADLKFINDRQKPVILHTEYERGKIRVLIFATKGEYPEVKLSSKIVQYLEAGKEILKDPTLAPGQTLVVEKGQRGMIVEVYREFISDGNVLSRELISKDKYKPQKAVIRVPVEE